MTNHVHILATSSDSIGIARMMQYIGRRYMPYINQTYGTSGSIWDGRYKANLVQEEHYLLNCMRYIELNPVRAKEITAYNALFKAHVDTEDLVAIRAAWQTGMPLGNECFREKIEKKLGCKVGQARRGRPIKTEGSARQGLQPLLTRR